MAVIKFGSKEELSWKEQSRILGTAKKQCDIPVAEQVSERPGQVGQPYWENGE